jgi:anti-sigma factor RsiW
VSAMGGASPAEQHLGDRLAALVDGELGHDARERVLAHLATCAKCKAEADAQRRLKSVFAETAPPGPSEGLLARLQGLPGGDASGPGSRLGSGGLGPGDFARGGGPFGYVPSGDHGRHTMSGVPPQPRLRGRSPEAERPAPQRRRFAFAAAGAVSLAAFALGGALPLEAAVDTPGGRADGTGSNVTPLNATPAAGSESWVRDDNRLATRDARSAPGAFGGGPTAAPVPGAMSLYGPGAPLPARLPLAVPDPMAGRFGLSPLIAATGTAPAFQSPQAPAGAGKTPARHLPPLPSPESERPMAGSAAPSGTPAEGSTAAAR